MTLRAMTYVAPLRTVEITAEPATSIDGVLERMHAIDDALSRHDGVAHFNRLYMRTTERILEAVQAVRFEDLAFLDLLDVRFANLYFAAFEADQHGHAVAPAWRLLFAGRAMLVVEAAPGSKSGAAARLTVVPRYWPRWPTISGSESPCCSRSSRPPSSKPARLGFRSM